MKFSTLKEFWDWLTISTGDTNLDLEALACYHTSGDFELLTKTQQTVFWDLSNIYDSIDFELNPFEY